MNDPFARLPAVRRGALAFACAMTMVTLAVSEASAAPTPIPGGATQVKGVTGTLQQTLFNGKLRLRKMVLREALPAEESGAAGDNVILLTYIFSNGTSKPIYGNTGLTAVDADGVSSGCKSVGVYGAYYSMGPAESKRLMLYCDLSPGFTPVKLLMTPGDGPAFRINLKPSDVPKPPAPAASATP